MEPNSDGAPPSELNVYQWQESEYMLIDWYAALVQSGDMAVTFTPAMRWMGEFLMYWRRVALLYACDKGGIYFAFWLEPILSGAFCGVWIAQRKRQSPNVYKLLQECYDRAFKAFTVLIGLSKQEHLQEIHEKLGYTHHISVPALWYGDAVDLYTLTRADWEKRNERRHANKQQLAGAASRPNGRQGLPAD